MSPFAQFACDNGLNVRGKVIFSLLLPLSLSLRTLEQSEVLLFHKSNWKTGCWKNALGRRAPHWGAGYGEDAGSCYRSWGAPVGSSWSTENTRVLILISFYCNPVCTLVPQESCLRGALQALEETACSLDWGGIVGVGFGVGFYY